MSNKRQERRLTGRLDDHRAAVREFIAAASALDARQWMIPRGEGKWTPAQETKHVVLAYDAFLRELRGGQGLAIRRTGLRRLIARAIGLSSILWLKRIPVAARSPREAMPAWEVTPAPELLALLQTRTAEFEATFEGIARTEPGRRLTHHLFGPLSLDQAIRLASVHTRHHAAFLSRQAVNGASR